METSYLTKQENIQIAREDSYKCNKKLNYKESCRHIRVQRRRKLSNIGPAGKNSSRQAARTSFAAILGVWGLAALEIYQNIALRLAEIAFPRDAF